MSRIGARLSGHDFTVPRARAIEETCECPASPAVPHTPSSCPEPVERALDSDAAAAVVRGSGVHATQSLETASPWLGNGVVSPLSVSVALAGFGAWSRSWKDVRRQCGGEAEGDEAEQADDPERVRPGGFGGCQ
jgi:hypothetical protein